MLVFGLFLNITIPHKPFTGYSLKSIFLMSRFRYDRATGKLLEARYYNDFIKHRSHYLRKTKSKMSKDKLLSSTLTLLKAPAYLMEVYL
jgi:hypothetical protein